MGRFVEITVEPGRLDASLARALARVCPVDIFILRGERLEVDESREDECILCGRCVALAADAVSVTRAYGPRRAVIASDSSRE